MRSRRGSIARGSSATAQMGYVTRIASEWPDRGRDMIEHIHTPKYEYFVKYYEIEGIVVGEYTIP